MLPSKDDKVPLTLVEEASSPLKERTEGAKSVTVSCVVVETEALLLTLDDVLDVVDRA